MMLRVRHLANRKSIHKAIPVTQYALYASKSKPLPGKRKQNVNLASATTRVCNDIQDHKGNVDQLLKKEEQYSFTEAKILRNLIYEQQMKDIRKQYKEEYHTKKQEEDRKSVQRFNDFRQKVLQYRALKREVTLKNIYRNQEVTDILSDERERFFREKYQRRLNIEASRHARMQDHLREMSKESNYYITPENLDRHIERELNPARVIIGPNIFGPGKYGVNDEVALHTMRYHQYQNRMNIEEDRDLNEHERKKQMFRISEERPTESTFGTESDPVPNPFYTNPVLFENKYITDILTPYVIILRDNPIMKKAAYENLDKAIELGLSSILQLDEEEYEEEEGEEGEEGEEEEEEEEEEEGETGEEEMEEGVEEEDLEDKEPVNLSPEEMDLHVFSEEVKEVLEDATGVILDSTGEIEIIDEEKEEREPTSAKGAEAEEEEEEEENEEVKEAMDILDEIAEELDAIEEGELTEEEKAERREAELDLEREEKEFSTTLKYREDPEFTEILQSVASFTGEKYENLLEDVKELLHEEEMEKEKGKRKRAEPEYEEYDPQQLALDIRDFEQFERMRRNPQNRLDARKVRQVLSKEKLSVKPDKKPEFHDQWIKSFPALSNELAKSLWQKISEFGTSSEDTLASIAMAIQKSNEVRKEFNTFLAQFLPIKETSDTEGDNLQTRVSHVYQKLRAQFGDKLFNSVKEGPIGSQLKNDLANVKSYLLKEGFPEETADLWVTVIESRILHKQMKRKGEK